jgi:hypothetical protein
MFCVTSDSISLCGLCVSVVGVFALRILLQWRFMQGSLSASAFESVWTTSPAVNHVPVARPPPAWDSVRVYVIIIFQWLCLQWWFIQGCIMSSAAETFTAPRIVRSARPPPAWGSLSALFGCLSALLLSPVSAVSSTVVLNHVHNLPCPVSLLMLLVVVPPWILLLLQSRWPVISKLMQQFIHSFGLVSLFQYCVAYPCLALGIWWWIVTLHSLACNYWWLWLKLASYIPIFAGVLWGVHLLAMLVTWCFRRLHDFFGSLCNTWSVTLASASSLYCQPFHLKW